jgi:hypothetical protein
LAPPYRNYFISTSQLFVGVIISGLYDWGIKMINKKLLLDEGFAACSIASRHLFMCISILDNKSIDYSAKIVRHHAFPFDQNISIADVDLMISELVNNGLLSIIDIGDVRHLVVSGRYIDVKEKSNYAQDKSNNEEPIPQEMLDAAMALNNPNIKDIYYVYRKYIAYHSNKGTNVSVASWVGWCKRERSGNNIKEVSTYEEQPLHKEQRTKSALEVLIQELDERILSESSRETNVVSINDYKNASKG